MSKQEDIIHEYGLQTIRISAELVNEGLIPFDDFEISYSYGIPYLKRVNGTIEIGGSMSTS